MAFYFTVPSKDSAIKKIREIGYPENSEGIYNALIDNNVKALYLFEIAEIYPYYGDIANYLEKISQDDAPSIEKSTLSQFKNLILLDRRSGCGYDKRNVVDNLSYLNRNQSKDIYVYLCGGKYGSDKVSRIINQTEIKLQKNRERATTLSIDIQRCVSFIKENYNNDQFYDKAASYYSHMRNGEQEAGNDKNKRALHFSLVETFGEIFAGSIRNHNYESYYETIIKDSCSSSFRIESIDQNYLRNLHILLENFLR